MLTNTLFCDTMHGYFETSFLDLELLAENITNSIFCQELHVRPPKKGQ